MQVTQLPLYTTVWLALTDATPDTSCMYARPASPPLAHRPRPSFPCLPIFPRPSHRPCLTRRGARVLGCSQVRAAGVCRPRLPGGGRVGAAEGGRGGGGGGGHHAAHGQLSPSARRRSTLTHRHPSRPSCMLHDVNTMACIPSWCQPLTSIYLRGSAPRAENPIQAYSIRRAHRQQRTRMPAARPACTSSRHASRSARALCGLIPSLLARARPHRMPLRAQFIRALPVDAGTALAWSHRLIHWGCGAPGDAPNARRPPCARGAGLLVAHCRRCRPLLACALRILTARRTAARRGRARRLPLRWRTRRLRR